MIKYIIDFSVNMSSDFESAWRSLHEKGSTLSEGTTDGNSRLSDEIEKLRNQLSSCIDEDVTIAFVRSLQGEYPLIRITYQGILKRIDIQNIKKYLFPAWRRMSQDLRESNDSTNIFREFFFAVEVKCAGIINVDDLLPILEDFQKEDPLQDNLYKVRIVAAIKEGNFSGEPREFNSFEEMDEYLGKVTKD